MSQTENENKDDTGQEIVQEMQKQVQHTSDTTNNQKWDTEMKWEARTAQDSLRTAFKTGASFPIKYEPPSDLTAEQLEQHCSIEAAQNVQVRLFRAGLIISAPIVFLTVLTYYPDKFSLFIGCNILFMYFLYFQIIFWMFFYGARKKERNLFRIYSSSNAVPGWVPMHISTFQLLYPNKAIQSISEFSAVHGAVSKTMLATLTAYTWAIVTANIAAYVSFYCDFKWDIADYLEIIGISGLVLIGIFELDPYNWVMKGFHYLGAGAGTGTIIGYLIQQYWIGEKFWLAVLIACVAFGAFGAWQFYNWRTEKFQEAHKHVTADTIDTIRDEITLYSLKNVISEAIFLILGILSVALWVIDYNQNCEIGCRGPANPKCAG